MMNIEYGKEPKVLEEVGIKKEDLCVTSAEKIQQLLADRVIYAATQYTKEEKAWVRIESAYLKDIKKEDGKIKVGRYKFLPIGEAHTHG